MVQEWSTHEPQKQPPKYGKALSATLTAVFVFFKSWIGHNFVARNMCFLAPGLCGLVQRRAATVEVLNCIERAAPGIVRRCRNVWLFLQIGGPPCC